MGSCLLRKIASDRQVDREKLGERKPFFLGVSVTVQPQDPQDVAPPNKLASPL